jgi:hypothetical protein
MTAFRTLVILTVALADTAMGESLLAQIRQGKMGDLPALMFSVDQEASGTVVALQVGGRVWSLRVSSIPAE